MILSQAKRSLFVLTLLLAGLALLVSGCAPAAAPSTQEAAGDAAEAGAAEQTLTFGMATEPVTLDPKDGLFIAERLILMNLFDTLTTVDQAGDLFPGLATAWEVNDAATEFTFTLRDDVLFHDGTPLDAAAVKNAFDRIVAAESATPAGTILAGYDSAEVVDDQTLTVPLAIPNRPSSAIWLSPGWAFRRPGPAADENFGQNPVGSGPFVFVEWAPQDRLVLAKNPDYAWGPELSRRRRSGSAGRDHLALPARAGDAADRAPDRRGARCGRSALPGCGQPGRRWRLCSGDLLPRPACRRT